MCKILAHYMLIGVRMPVILINRGSVFKCTLLYLLENLSCSGVKYSEQARIAARESEDR